MSSLFVVFYFFSSEIWSVYIYIYTRTRVFSTMVWLLLFLTAWFLDAAQAPDVIRLAKDFLEDTREKHISASLSTVPF